MLCLNAQEERDEEFNLSAYSNVDYTLAPGLDLFSELSHHSAERGEWKEGLSGGNISEVTFNRNPNYLLRLSKNTKLIVQIVSEGRTPLGLYLIKVKEEKSLSQITQSELENAIATSSFLAKSNSLFCESGGEEEFYLVVPCAYTSKMVVLFEPRNAPTS